jgi:hypothetical protein
MEGSIKQWQSVNFCSLWNFTKHFTCHCLKVSNIKVEYKNKFILQSDPTFVPIKFPDPSDRSSGTESDDSSVKSVRFSKLAEVSFIITN